MSGQNTPRTALLVIDVQDGFLDSIYWGPSRSNPSFETNAKSLIATYRSLAGDASSNHKIIHIRHASTNPSSLLHPSSPGFSFQAFAKPQDGELEITKNVNSGFIGTNLEEVLRAHFQGDGVLYVIGLTTDHCVSTTTRMAANLGVCGKGEVILVQDATAAWKKSEDGFDAELVHQVNVESLREFASISKTEDVLKLWGPWKK